ncbi:MAG: hypothetical protein HS117_10895 [Verrucomicrobiaceae bacterium]|nr:hypothetical protein [Verrucomicrobiaceae bacterium]
MQLQSATVSDFASDYQGKLCVLGCFDTLCASSFPVVHPQCSLAVRLIFQPEDAGTHEFVIRCLDPDGAECMPPMPAHVEVAFNSTFIPFVSRNIIFTLQRVKFERPGFYRWLLVHQDQTLATIPLRVTQFDGSRGATGPAG